MFTILSLVTSIKDYIEVVHKLVETNNSNIFELTTYSDFGAILSYFIISIKELFITFISLKWLQNIVSLPLIIPDIASAMISEISVLDGYFHNSFTFLETPISYGNQNVMLYGIEKFSIGLLNSIFLCLPTSTAHIITLRRFLMQGLEAGYLAGLGTLAGNVLWIGSIVFGLRFLVIPWLSFDILRYGLGFLLLAKYMWDTYNEKKVVLEDLSKGKIFLLNFLLSFTEQATLYPFLNNLSIGSDTTILESFPTNSFSEYLFIHTLYLGGLIIGGLSLLQFTCWFLENPAFNLYMWSISSLKLTTISQKFLNVLFLYLTMFFAISNLSYFGLDYLVTNPLGFVYEDRIIDQKSLFETGFLNSKASDRNTRRNRGRHGRRERWKRRVRRYRTFDASLYDQGVYDLFTIEDLNYGFDRFWLRRKIRNHRVRFRFFPGPWMRSFKKQLARPRLESFMGPRVEFFRILFEQAYHPEFHEFRDSKNGELKEKRSKLIEKNTSQLSTSFYSDKSLKLQSENLKKEYSALRKFVRKVKTRTNLNQILLESQQQEGFSSFNSKMLKDQSLQNKIYSKRWKEIFSKISHKNNPNSTSKFFQQNFLLNLTNKENQENLNSNIKNYYKNLPNYKTKAFKINLRTSKDLSQNNLSQKDRQILRYKTLLLENTISNNSSTTAIYKPLTLLHPISVYLQKEQAFQKKMKFYGANLFRNFGIENNAPYYRIMMKKFFYYYKPTLRWERTMRNATMRKARRKNKRTPRKLNIAKQTEMLGSLSNSINLDTNQFDANRNFNITNVDNGKTEIQKPTHFYSLVTKRATRYRYQIYKDVLQHWYYSPFNRLLLKFDVDAFIRRQPRSHFLTKKEENLLHLKRFLLGDYYNTLRWYNYMEQYNSMKNTIGKTKSFASNPYNQQFFGTFKKIRHLFSITPSLSTTSILKFDQPLFNDYSTKLNKINNNLLNYNTSIIHEELLNDDQLYSSVSSIGQDLTNQSSLILKEYLKKATPVRENYIKQLIRDNNYVELTNFLFKGKKVRGTNPVTNETELLNQEKNYLLNFDNKKVEEAAIKKFFETKLLSSNSKDLNISNSLDNSTYLWISLMKKSRNMLYNQEALKFYVNGRLDKHEKQKKRQEKAFKLRLENIKKWVYTSSLSSNQTNQDKNNQLSGLTTSLQKAIKEGLYFQNSQFISGKHLEKSNLRNNNKKISLNLLEFNSRKIKPNILNSKKNNLSKTLRIHLNNRVKLKALQILETEKRFRTLFTSIQTVQRKNLGVSFTNLRPNILQKLVNSTLVPFKFISLRLSQTVERELKTDKTNLLKTSLHSVFKIFTGTTEKTLQNWKKKETVFLLRKKIRRKIYRVLDQKKSLEKNSNVAELENFSQKRKILKKEDISEFLDVTRSQKMWNNYKQQKLERLKTSENSIENKSNFNLLQTSKFSKLFEKQFKRKRTRSRRYRYFKGRGPIKKHTRAEKLKRQFKLLKRYGKNAEVADKKIEILQMITKRQYQPNAFFEIRDMKQRRTRQSKHRYWKKHKRQKYLQIKRKQRKRRRSTISKLRVLNKEFKRIKNQVKLKSWWSESFLPNFMNTFDNYWQMEKNKQIKQELDKLSIKDIFERDELNSQTINSVLQIGDKDFKPLALPQALVIKNTLEKSGQLAFGSDLNLKENFNSTVQEFNNIENNSTPNLGSNTTIELQNKNNIISKVSSNLFETSNLKNNFTNEEFLNSKKLITTTPMPFYAGWDETLHKFVVTNRLLSRKEAGYSMNFSPMVNSKNISKQIKIDQFDKLTNLLNNNTLQFTKAPLQGMNAATTLYWQIPFTTYDPDQFFALGMDGFSPLGWRFFNFKHSKETTKPVRVKTIFSKNENKMKYNSLLTYSIQLKMMELNQSNLWNSRSYLRKENNRITKNQTRKIQKRQKRVKKHPRPPVWFPSGPLANQILPVHYIYVFYKRTRLPRDRYIARRFRRSNDIKSDFLKANFKTMFDFTLRKRVKPIRKYHRKKGLNKIQEGSLVVRRRGFKHLLDQTLLIRPIVQTRLTNQSNFLNASLLKSKERKKTLTSKPGSENLRIRQLRRRIQRQVLRPVWRYKPRAGGFLWPGDYFRLEEVQAPLLKNMATNNQQQSLNSIRKKKRRSIQEWQIQPKKYLLEKHNLKVIKKRLRNAQNFNKMNYKIEELNLHMGN